MRKKHLIILIITLIITLIIFTVINNPRIVAYINWKVYLPKPQKIDTIYNFEFREGEDLEIWYYSENGVRKIISNNTFKSINKQNKDLIKQKLYEYYDILNDDNKNLFNANVDIDSLLLEENYFTYIEKEDSSWLLLILDYKNNKMFSFENIY